MDFTFSEEQEMFRKAAREFAEVKLSPWVAEMEATGKVCPAVVKALAEAGHKRGHKRGQATFS